MTEPLIPKARGLPDANAGETGDATVMKLPIFTIGHSDHTTDEFLALLTQHGIQAIADVRSTPYSRHVPHFNKDSISAFLKSHRKQVSSPISLAVAQIATRFWQEHTGNRVSI